MGSRKSPPPGGKPVEEGRIGKAQRLNGKMNARTARVEHIRGDEERFSDEVDACWDAIREANIPPSLFLHGHSIAEIRRADDGACTIRHLDTDEVYDRVDRLVHFVEPNEEDRLRPTHPDKKLILGLTKARDKPLPILLGVVAAPQVSETGRIVADEGYDRETQLYLTRSFDLSQVHESPSPQDVRAAVDFVLNDMLRDFPFERQSDRAHALALLLSIFLQAHTSRPWPLFFVGASTPGSGKNHLVKLFGAVAFGEPVRGMTLGGRELNVQLELTSRLRSGHPAVLIDNIADRLDSATLAAVITETTYSGRVVKSSDNVTLPTPSFWLATGNNTAFHGEWPRRIVMIRLTPKEEHPEERTEFLHPDLLAWATENRERILQHLLVIVRAWVAAGRPRSAKTLGSFEAWAHDLGGILEYAGVDGFLEDRERTRQAVDGESEEVAMFVPVWAQVKGTALTSATELAEIARSQPDLLPSIRAKVEREETLHLQIAQMIKRAKDRRCAGFWIRVQYDHGRKANLYRLERAE